MMHVRCSASFPCHKTTRCIAIIFCYASVIHLELPSEFQGKVSDWRHCKVRQAWRLTFELQPIPDETALIWDAWSVPGTKNNRSDVAEHSVSGGKVRGRRNNTVYVDSELNTECKTTCSCNARGEKFMSLTFCLKWRRASFRDFVILQVNCRHFAENLILFIELGKQFLS